MFVVVEYYPEPPATRLKCVHGVINNPEVAMAWAADHLPNGREGMGIRWDVFSIKSPDGLPDLFLVKE